MADPLQPDVKVTWSEFVFNADMDESLFNMEPPAGYKVSHLQANMSVGDEKDKDLVDALRIFSEASGGTFPDALGAQTNQKFRDYPQPSKKIMARERELMEQRQWKKGQKLSQQQVQEIEDFELQAPADDSRNSVVAYGLR